MGLTKWTSLSLHRGQEGGLDMSTIQFLSTRGKTWLKSIPLVVTHVSCEARQRNAASKVIVVRGRRHGFEPLSFMFKSRDYFLTLTLDHIEVVPRVLLYLAGKIIISVGIGLAKAVEIILS